MIHVFQSHYYSSVLYELEEKNTGYSREELENMTGDIYLSSCDKVLHEFRIPGVIEFERDSPANEKVNKELLNLAEQLGGQRNEFGASVIYNRIEYFVLFNGLTEAIPGDLFTGRIIKQGLRSAAITLAPKKHFNLNV